MYEKIPQHELYGFYECAVYEITDLDPDPGYDVKMVKDLISGSLQLVQNSPPMFEYDVLGRYHYPSDLRKALVEGILCRDKNPQLMSILEFMVAENQKAGMVIKKGVALGSGTHHEYDQVFHDNLHD